MASFAAKRVLEALMSTSTWPVYSTLARKHFGEGKAEGLAEGEARAVLTLLEARGVPVTDSTRGRITACHDLTQLDTWIRRAATATTADEIFD